MLNRRTLIIILFLLTTSLFGLLACQANLQEEALADSFVKVTPRNSTTETPVMEKNPTEAAGALVIPTATPSATPTSTSTPLPVNSFLETFDGDPASPQPWPPVDWDVTVHSRDRETWFALEEIPAAHGPNCEPPPATHLITAYEETVYKCRNHMMTALRATGYGVIYLAPNQLVDFSEGEAVIKFDLSTLRTSNRDWIDIWISPYEDNLQLPLRSTLPDLTGEPRRAVQVFQDIGQFTEDGQMIGARFKAKMVNQFDVQELKTQESRGYEQLLTPDAKRRDTFELRISQTHLKFGMPDYDLWWIDTEIPPLDWSQGVVQLGHHSYNPLKECPDTCAANTWHWDNVYISPAKPFTILRADKRYVDEETTATLNFPAPAPQNAHLRFAGIGNNLEVSVDGGTIWQAAQLQAQQEELLAEEHFKSYWMPIPAGTSSVQLRGEAWWGAGWHVRDISIWSPEAE